MNGKRLRAGLALAAALTALGAAGRSSTPGPNAVAIVNGREITDEQFAADLAEGSFLPKPDTIVWRFSVLNKRIEKLLLEQEARRLGYQKRPRLVRAAEKMRRQYAVSRIKGEAVAQAKREITPERVAAEAGKLPETIDVTVLVADSAEVAQAADRRIRSGEKLEAAAAAVAAGGEARTSVRKGYVPHNGMYSEAVDSELRALPVGGITRLIETPMGFLVVRLDARNKPTPQQLAEHLAAEAQRLGDERIAKEIESMAEAARAKTPPKILLERWPTAGLPDPAADDLAIWKALDEIPVARIGEVTLVLTDLFTRAADYRLLAKRTGAGRENGFVQLRDAAVLGVLLQQPARERGIDREPAVLKIVENFYDQVLVLEFVQDVRETVRRESLAPSVCRKFFEENRERYPVPVAFRISEILVRRKEEADGVAARLAAGADFAALAREASVDDAARRGGDLGLVTAPDLEKRWPKEMVDELTKQAAAGKRVPLRFRTSAGYHLVVAREFFPAEKAGYEAVKEKVDSDCLQSERDKAFKERLAKLRAAAAIGIDEAKVMVVKPARDASGQPRVHQEGAVSGPGKAPQGGSPHSH